MTTPAATPAVTAAQRQVSTLAWVSASLSALVVSMNLSVMSVAFDALGTSFPEAKLSTLGWELSVYTIVFGAFLVPAGRLADHLGRRRVFLVGLVIFTIASLIAAVAPAIWIVIAGRVGQGIGAAHLRRSRVVTQGTGRDGRRTRNPFDGLDRDDRDRPRSGHERLQD